MSFSSWCYTCSAHLLSFNFWIVKCCFLAYSYDARLPSWMFFLPEFFRCQWGYLVRCCFLGSYKCMAIYAIPNSLDAAFLTSVNVRLSLWFDISLYSFWKVRLRQAYIFCCRIAAEKSQWDFWRNMKDLECQIAN